MKMQIKSKVVLSSFIFVILITVACWFFSEGSFRIQNRSDKPDKVAAKNSSQTSSRVQVVNGAATIELSPPEREQSGITTIKLSQTLHQAQLTSYGTVVSIHDLSKDVQNYEADKAQLARSKESLLISQKNYERVKSLYEKTFASEQDYQTSQAAYLSDKADMNSAQSNLTGLESSIVEQWGTGISKWIFTGSASLQRLLALDNSLIQISLPPNEMNAKIPEQIFIQPSLDNNLKISCRFVSSGNLANAQFQTKTLYYIASSSLSGGMNVKAFLPVGKNLAGVMVPSESIVWYQGKAWIYVEKFPDKFIRVEVDTDNPADGGFFVPRNDEIINYGATVVKNGAQLLLSEELTPAQSSQGGGGDND